MRSQVFSAVKKYTGFGIRFTVSVIKLGSLEFSLFDVEFIYSVEQLGQCSKFRKVYEILNGEKSVKVLARSTTSQRLGYFIFVGSSSYLSIAFSMTSFKFVAHVHAHVAVLGITVSTDLLIRNNGLQFVIEGNIWNVFFARVEFSAGIGRKWYDIAFSARGQLLARSNDTESDFQVSYLYGIRMIAWDTSDKANKRLTAVQNKLFSAQRSMDNAKSKLTSAQDKIRKAHSALDSAVESLNNANDSLERARAPLQRAFERNVDRLCQIKTCHSVCVPGVKLDMCKKGWVRYPCLKLSGCQFRIPNLLCEAANLACRGVRAIAYDALEAAKIFVRVPMLAFDAAKALVSASQFVVDKARVVLDVAVGILEIAELGLDAAKEVLEVAKPAVEGVKFIVRAALHVFELIIKYGLQNLLDVKNCHFEILLSVKDIAEFEVSCDVQAFRRGWHTFKFEFDFKHPLNSMWRMAKSTVKSLLDIVKSILRLRKKRDIFDPIIEVKESKFDIIKKMSDTNETNTNTINTIYLRNVEGNRVEFFAENCVLFQNIYGFLSSSIYELVSITNDSVSAFNEVGNIHEMLSQMQSSIALENMTAEALGINPAWASKDYNITMDELQSVIQSMNITGDPLIKDIASSTTFARKLLADQLAYVANVTIITHWFSVVENLTKEYFNDSECVGFQDCVLYSFELFSDLFHDDTMPNSTENANRTRQLQTEIQNLLDDENRSIVDTYNLSSTILQKLIQLNASNVFCSEKPTITSSFKNQTSKIGSTFTFVCQVEGNPLPTIQWYHNGRIITGENNTVLVIDKVSKADSGSYKCEAGNLVANVSSPEAFLKVEEQRQKLICSGLWGYFPNPMDCSGFVHCVWGFPRAVSCPEGTIWNQKLLACHKGKC